MHGASVGRVVASLTRRTLTASFHHPFVLLPTSISCERLSLQRCHSLIVSTMMRRRLPTTSTRSHYRWPGRQAVRGLLSLQTCSSKHIIRWGDLAFNLRRIRSNSQQSDESRRVQDVVDDRIGLDGLEGRHSRVRARIVGAGRRPVRPQLS